MINTIREYKKINTMKFSQLTEMVVLRRNVFDKITQYAPGIWKRVNGNVTYYCNNPECKNSSQLHRLDGPAVVWDDGMDSQFYINGHPYQQDEYWQFVKKFKESSGEAQDLLNI